MQETGYVLTDRAERIMSLLDRLLAMPQEERVDFAHELYCASQFFMTAEDDMEGATCLLDALERLVAVSPVPMGGCDVN